jgi:protein involved in polysaccharide export with SLBB domain
LTGAEVTALSRPKGTVSSIGVTSVRNGLAQSAFYSSADFAKVILSDGDHVNLRSDVFTQSISVTIQGDLKGPSIFVLPRGAKLSQLLSKVPLEDSDVEATYVHIERPSVAVQQKEALDRALDNLEKAALTAPATSSETASIASGQASQLERFIARARQATPSGKVAVYTEGQFHDLKLESGDRVIFPNRTDVVLVAGETVSPGAFVFAEGQTIQEYVNRAGGFAPNANKSRFALRRPDGSAVVARARHRPRPGDEIVVVPNIVNPGFLLFKDITTIVFQLMTTTAAAINISN